MRDKIADNREDTAKHGRRATDHIEDEAVLSQASSGLWNIIRNSIGVAFVLTVCVGVGRFSGQVDSNVKSIDENKVAIKEILIQNNTLLLALTAQNIQQKESDKRFEEKFDDANHMLNRINDGVKQNRENIIILQNGKVSISDKTSVYLAMR
jgi:hypothetical protein